MKVHFESIDEFVEWSWKEKQHKEELQQHNTELEIENRRLKAEIIQFQQRNKELAIHKQEAKAELQEKREYISDLIMEYEGPAKFPIDDLPDDYS